MDARSGLGRPKQMSVDDWIVVTEERLDNPDIEDKDLPWFWGRLERHVAEDQLSKSPQLDGTFLVRESDAIKIEREPVYMISVLLNGETHHVEIKKRSNGKFTLAMVSGAKEFKSLDKLVRHYRNKPLDLEGGGQTKLKYFVENTYDVTD